MTLISWTMVMMAEVKGKNRNNLTVVALVVAIVMTIAMIFLHSMQGTDASFAESDAVAALLEPLLRRFYGLFCGITALFGNIAPFEYEVFVRRLAHFIEYFLLSAECVSLTVVLTSRVSTPYLWTDMFAVLMVAVLDEFVQSFVGRSSLVKDILLDFSGGITGLVIVLIVASIVKRKARRA